MAEPKRCWCRFTDRICWWNHPPMRTCSVTVGGSGERRTYRVDWSLLDALAMVNSERIGEDQYRQKTRPVAVVVMVVETQLS